MRATAVGGCALLVTQSALHLIATLGFHSTDSLVDLDRSNGIPDIVSVAIILSQLLSPQQYWPPTPETPVCGRWHW